MTLLRSPSGLQGLPETGSLGLRQDPLCPDGDEGLGDLPLFARDAPGFVFTSPEQLGLRMLCQLSHYRRLRSVNGRHVFPIVEQNIGPSKCNWRQHHR